MLLRKIDCMPFQFIFHSLFAAGFDWLEAILPLLFVLIWIISQVVAVFRRVRGGVRENTEDDDNEDEIISNKKDLIAFYKKMRTNVQDGYKYSLLDKSRIVWLSKDVYMIDATYSRYNDEYKRIFQGRGVYMYKKTDNKWKMFSVSSLPIAKKKVKKPKQ